MEYIGELLLTVVWALIIVGVCMAIGYAAMLALVALVAVLAGNVLWVRHCVEKSAGKGNWWLIKRGFGAGMASSAVVGFFIWLAW